MRRFKLESRETTVIKELDIVVLKQDVPEEHLKAGDVGTVVMVHGQGVAYEIEFLALDGETLAVVELDASKVRPPTGNEIMHSRKWECG